MNEWSEKDILHAKEMFTQALLLALRSLPPLREEIGFLGEALTDFVRSIEDRSGVIAIIGRKDNGDF